VIFKTAGSFSKENFLGTLYSPLLPWITIKAEKFWDSYVRV
jgi:hypothetical protein